MKKVIEAVKRLDKQHNDWMESLEPWQETLYIAFMCLVVFGLWSVRPPIIDTWIDSISGLF